MVPLSAHALFARPLVVGPDSSLAVEVLSRTERQGRPLVRRPSRRTTCRRAPGSSAPRSPEPVRPGAPPARSVHRPPRGQVPAARHRLAGPDARTDGQEGTA